jgi:hypothetical protein
VSVSTVAEIKKNSGAETKPEEEAGNPLPRADAAFRFGQLAK